jgi:hypothetical protein
MNGGTSLRREGASRFFAAFSIDFTLFYPATRPAPAAFGRLLGAAQTQRMS